MYKRILTTVNEHLNSEVTARYALSLAKVCGAKLYLCFVAEKEMTAPTINRAGEAVKRIFLEAEKNRHRDRGYNRDRRPCKEDRRTCKRREDRYCLCLNKEGRY